MTTLDLFTREFTMPDGTTRPPLVERVPEIKDAGVIRAAWPDGVAFCDGHNWTIDEVMEALLIVAAHRWVRRERETVHAAVNLEVMNLLHDWALHGRDDDLVFACHLIADSLAAKGNA